LTWVNPEAQVNGGVNFDGVTANITGIITVLLDGTGKEVGGSVNVSKVVAHTPHGVLEVIGLISDSWDVNNEWGEDRITGFKFVSDNGLEISISGAFDERWDSRVDLWQESKVVMSVDLKAGGDSVSLISSAGLNATGYEIVGQINAINGLVGGQKVSVSGNWTVGQLVDDPGLKDLISLSDWLKVVETQLNLRLGFSTVIEKAYEILSAHGWSLYQVGKSVYVADAGQQEGQELQGGYRLAASNGREWSIPAKAQPVGLFFKDGNHLEVFTESIDVRTHVISYVLSVFDMDDDTATAIGKPQILNAHQLMSLERDYQVDLNADGLIGDTIARVVGDGIANREVDDGDGFGLYQTASGGWIVGETGLAEGDSTGDAVPLSVRNKPYALKPPAHSETALLVLANGGFEVVTGSGARWFGQKFSAEGVAQARASTYTLTKLLSLESHYGEDINGDGRVGDTIARVVDDGIASRHGADDGYGLYQTASGGWIVGESGLEQGQSTGNAVSLNVGKKPYALKMTATSQTALLVRDAGHVDGPGFEVVTGSGARWSGQKFNADGVAIGRATTYTLSQLLGLESDYGADINGDGGIGDSIVRVVDDGIANSQGAEDDFGLYQTASGNWIVGESGLAAGDSTGNAISLSLASNKPYILRTAANRETALLVRDDNHVDGPGFEVVTGSGARWSGQKFSAEGMAQGSATTYTLSQLLRLERIYGEDINRDSDIGDFVQDTLLFEGLYKTETGAFVIDVDGDGYSISADAIYLSVGTKPWTPGRANVVGVMEINDEGSTEVLLQNGTSYAAQIFNAQGLAQGKTLTLKGSALVNREFFYDLDMNRDEKVEWVGIPSGWDEGLFM
jgi:hypothetical protein